MSEFQARLKRLHRRDWFLWWGSVTVILLLTFAVVSLSLPTLFSFRETFFEFNLNQAVRGLVGAVLLFNVYSIYQQIIVKRLHRQLAEQIEETARLETHAEALRQLAMLDPLTELHNRRFAEERLRAEVSRFDRSGHPLTVVMLDLDDFKQINDQHGHAAGDEVLKGFATRLKSLVRASDLAIRMGGDEFLVVMVDCVPEMAGRLVGRIGVPEVHYQGAKIAVRFSAGWAGCRRGESAEKLLERADRALYEAKRAGKSRVKGVPVTAA